MVDVAAVAGAMSSLKATQDILKAMLGLRDAAKVREKVVELQGLILAAQSDAFEANVAQAALLERVRELEKQVADLEAWEAEKQRYELKEVAPGAFAYALKADEQRAEPTHWICAGCYEHRRKSILQRSGLDVTSVLFKCFACDAVIRAGGPGRFAALAGARSTSVEDRDEATWRTA